MKFNIDVTAAAIAIDGILTHKDTYSSRSTRMWSQEGRGPSGAGSNVFSFTTGECVTSLAATSPSDRGTIEGHDVSGYAAACAGVSSKIVVDPSCQNVAVVGTRVAIRQDLVVSASHVCKSTFSGCHVDRARVMQK